MITLSSYSKYFWPSPSFVQAVYLRSKLRPSALNRYVLADPNVQLGAAESSSAFVNGRSVGIRAQRAGIDSLRATRGDNFASL